MPDIDPQPTGRAAVARFLDATGWVVGAGWRIAPGVVATCAHVVAAAAGRHASCDAPEGPVRLDFPFAPQPGPGPGAAPPRTAEVYRWVPIRSDGSGDLALLRLTDGGGAPDAAPTPVLRTPDALWNQPFWVVGFPVGTPGGAEGVWTGGHLRGQQGTGLCQLQTGVGEVAVSPGFSGAPVWAGAGPAVVGLTVAGDREAGSRTAYLLPIDQVLAADLDLLPCPYRGMAPFDEDDAALFHGRDVHVGTVVDKLAAQPLVLVAGRSGVGKSSLIRAGVVPAVRARGMSVRLHRVPADGSPHDEFAELVGTGAGAGDGELLIVLDQFEELVSADAPAAAELLRLCLRLAESHPRVRLLATVRWDSLVRLNTPELSERLSAGTVFLPPMTRDELRRAVTTPAEFAPGLQFEPGLVDVILDDAGDEPGRLPLVGALLRGLWDRRDGSLLTHRAYRESGGVGGAIARLADDAVDGFDAEQVDAVRRLFGRLVAVDPEQRDFRRRAVPLPTLPEAERTLVPVLVAARLLVVDGRRSTQTVEIAHQALVDCWPRLDGWLNEDRDFLAWQAEAEEQRRLWEEAEEDQGALLRGSSLAAATGWVRSRDEQITEPLRRYIGQSQAGREREQRRLRAAVAVLVVLVVVAASFAVLARQRTDRITAGLATARAAALGQAALDRSVTDPITATQLALSAVRSDPRETKAHAALLDRYAAQRSVESTLPRLATGPVRVLRSSLDGHVLAVVAADGVTVLSDSASGPVTGRWTVGVSPDSAFELSPDGRWGTSISPQGEVDLWDLGTRTRRPLLHTGPVDPAKVLAAFSVGGSYLAVALADRSDLLTGVTVWDLRSGAPLQVWTPGLRYPPGTMFRGLWIDDDGRAVQVATERADPAAAQTLRSLDTWTRGTQDSTGPASSLDTTSVPSTDGTQTYTCVGPTPPPGDVGRAAATTTSGVLPGTSPRSRINVATRADHRPVRSIPLPTFAGCWNTALTADGEHVLVPGRGVGDQASPHHVIISVRTGKAYGVTLPSGPGTRTGGLPGFSSVEPLVTAVDGPDGSLTVHVARGNSLYRLRGRFDWLSTLPSDESGPMTSEDGRYAVTRGARDDALYVHDTSDGRELARLEAGDLGRSSFGGLEGSATGQALNEILGRPALRTDEFGVAGQVLTQMHSDAGSYRYVERALPDLRVLADLAIPAHRNSGYRAQVITTPDRVFALVGGDTKGDQLMLSVFDRRDYQMVGEPVEVGEPLRSAASAEHRRLVMLQDPADPDRLLLTDSAGRLVLWSVSGGGETASTEFPLLQSVDGVPVGFDPSGNRIVALDTDDALHVFNARSLDEIRDPIPLRGVEEVVGVTPDGFVMVVEPDRGLSTGTLQFWNADTGSLSGSLPIDDLDELRVREGGRAVTIVRSGSAPEELVSDGRRWFDALCVTDGRPMTADEATIVPEGASTNPCAPA